MNKSYPVQNTTTNFSKFHRCLLALRVLHGWEMRACLVPTPETQPEQEHGRVLKENIPYVSPLDWSPLVPLLHQSLVDVFCWVFLFCWAGEDFAHSRFMQCLVFPALTPATLLRVAAYKTGWIYLYRGLWAWGRGPSPLLLEESSFDSSKVNGVLKYRDLVMETNFHVWL